MSLCTVMHAGVRGGSREVEVVPRSFRFLKHNIRDDYDDLTVRTHRSPSPEGMPIAISQILIDFVDPWFVVP